MVRVLLITAWFLTSLLAPAGGEAVGRAVRYPVPPPEHCFADAGARYHIDPLLLEAIARHESGLNPTAVNGKNRDGSADYGEMQINSRHIPGLIKEGLIRDKKELLTRPCLNIQIGARLLARHFQTCGVNWNCLGSYNAGFAKRNHQVRENYAGLIWPVYRRLLRERRGVIL